MILRFLLVFLLPLFLFQNCSDGVNFSESKQAELGSEVQGNGDGSDINDDSIDLENPATGDVNLVLGEGDQEQDLDVITKLCAKYPAIVKEQDFNFPEPKSTCDWGKDGNLDQRDGYFQARIEQHRSLDLPEGAIICDAKFEFEQQKFHYDDHFLFLFNEKVIASSYDFRSKFEVGNYGLLRYDWAKMAGMDWITKDETIFCPEGAMRENLCSFPGHDQSGTINFDYDPAFIKAIMSEGIPKDHSFSMVSIGDNDRLDCEHSEVNFTVQVSYIVPK